jgi:DNA-binding LytR/AlgR family response regulator
MMKRPQNAIRTKAGQIPHEILSDRLRYGGFARIGCKPGMKRTAILFEIWYNNSQAEVSVMNVLICDDMKQEILKLERVLDESGFDVKTVSFQSGYDVLDYVRSGAFIDVCFFDIVMPDMSGVEIAEELRVAGFTGEIVFFTTSNEYAAESYNVKALSYLLKPLNLAHVRGILQRLEDTKRNSDSEGLLIKVSKVARFLQFRDISHAEVIKHYVYFRLTDGEEIEIYATLGEIAAQLLNDARFAQCHRSYIVNMSEIVSIDDREIVMRGGKKLPVSESYSDIKKTFTKWMIGGTAK